MGGKIWQGLVILLVILNGFFAWKWQIDKAEKHHVFKIIDGDTFITDRKQSIRLLGIDAPELDKCLGQESKQKLEQLISNKDVLIKESITDKYGRILAIVYKGSININKTMINNGYASYDRAACKLCDDLIQAQEYAKNNELGVFSKTCYQSENPEKSECTIKGNINKKNGSKIYHFPGCGRYEELVVELSLGEQWFCSEKEAKNAGFEKSKNCFDKKF